MIGPELVQETTEKIRVIRERLLAAQSRKKIDADHRRKNHVHIGESKVQSSPTITFDKVRKNHVQKILQLASIKRAHV